MTLGLRRRFGTTLLALLLTGCAGQWTTVRDGPRALAGGGGPDARLILARGDTVVIRRATLRGDSIVSLHDHDTRTVAVGDVTRVATWRSSAERTFGAVALTASGTLVAMIAYAAYRLRGWQ